MEREKEEGRREKERWERDNKGGGRKREKRRGQKGNKEEGGRRERDKKEGGRGRMEGIGSVYVPYFLGICAF